MEDDLKKEGKKKTTSKKIICSWFLLNLGANLSWGWLSSLRFFWLFWSFIARSVLRGMHFLANIRFIFPKFSLNFNRRCHATVYFPPEHKFHLRENISLVIVFVNSGLISKAAILNVNSCVNILARSIFKYFFSLEFLWLDSRMT